MTTILLLGTFWASQYSVGVMSEVIRNRQACIYGVCLPDPLPAVDGFVAVRECHRIGATMMLRRPGGPWETFLVVDCARPGDGTAEWMGANNIVAEVDYHTARRWDTVGVMCSVEVGIEMVGARLEE